MVFRMRRRPPYTFRCGSDGVWKSFGRDVKPQLIKCVKVECEELQEVSTIGSTVNAVGGLPKNSRWVQSFNIRKHLSSCICFRASCELDIDQLKSGEVKNVASIWRTLACTQEWLAVLKYPWWTYFKLGKETQHVYIYFMARAAIKSLHHGLVTFLVTLGLWNGIGTTRQVRCRTTKISLCSLLFHCRNESRRG